MMKYQAEIGNRCGGMFLDNSDPGAFVVSENRNGRVIFFLVADKSIYWNAEILTADAL